MKLVPLVLTALALAAPLALAQGQTSFNLNTFTEGGGGYFRIEGDTVRNPNLVVPAGETITVVLRGNDDGVHNIQVAGQGASEFVTSDGETIQYEFTAPASGSVEYWCVPHKAAGMKGKVVVAGSEPTVGSSGGGDGGATNDTPGVPIALVGLAVVGLALATRSRRA